MLFRIILILTVLIVVLVAVIPFTLNLFGTNFPGFALIGLGRLSGVSAKILISRDDGKSWDEIEIVGDKNTVSPSVVFDLEFHPLNSTLIYLGTEGSGLWRSINGGKSWGKFSDKSEILKFDADVYRVVASRSDPSVIYLAVFQDNRGRVLKSVNGGHDFREVYFTPDGSGVLDLFVDPIRSQSPEAIADSQANRTSNGVNPNDSDRVIIITGNGGLFETRDGGSTWSLIQWLAVSPVGFAVNPLNSEEMYIAASSGKIFKTADSGKTLEEMKVEIDPTDVENTPRSEGDLYKQIFKQNIFSNLGNIFGFDSSVIFINPENFNDVIMGLPGGVFRSFDRGISWYKIQTIIPLGTKIDALALYPVQNSIMVIAGGEVYRTDDGGKSWQVHVITGRPKVSQLFIHPLKQEVIFAILGK